MLQINILFLLLTTFFPCFLGYILFPCLLQITILFFLLTTFFPCFLGYILFPCLLQITILFLLLTTFFPCFLGYILFMCLLQIIILFLLLTTFFPWFFGYILFPCLLQAIILPFSTIPLSLHFINYNPKLRQPHTNIIISELQQYLPKKSVTPPSWSGYNVIFFQSKVSHSFLLIKSKHCLHTTFKNGLCINVMPKLEALSLELKT